MSQTEKKEKPPSYESPRLVVGIPSRGKVHISWALMLSALEWPVGEVRNTRITNGEQVATARCNLAMDAIQQGAEYLFFIDDDVRVPNFAPRRMIYQMETNPEWDLLTGVYVTKSAPPEPLIFNKEQGNGAFWDWRCGETFPITGCGMGCCLIRVSAFEKIEEPYFAWTSKRDGVNSDSEGEDLYFCRKLHEAGGTLMCDGAVLCGHIDVNRDRLYQLWKDTPPYKNALPDFLSNAIAGLVGDESLLTLQSPGRKEQKKPSGIAGY
jgi:hypothetical protein